MFRKSCFCAKNTTSITTKMAHNLTHERHNFVHKNAQSSTWLRELSSIAALAACATLSFITRVRWFSTTLCHDQWSADRGGAQEMYLSRWLSVGRCFGDDSGTRERGETTLDDSTRVRCTVMCRLCTSNDHQLLGHAHQTEQGSDS